MSLFQQVNLHQVAQDSSANTNASTNFAGTLGSSLISVVGAFLCCLFQLKGEPLILDSGATNYMTPHKYYSLMFPYFLFLNLLLFLMVTK